MNDIKLRYISTPCGELILGSYNARLCLCDWRARNRRAAIDNRLMSALHAPMDVGDDHLLHRAEQQLREYFNGERQVFDIPLLMVGTDFQKTVWRCLLRIPYGNTWSYRDLAQAVGRKQAVRAVAAANGANAISLMIPCHRVIGSDGQLTGYAGGLAVKRKLLEREKTYSSNESGFPDTPRIAAADKRVRS